MRRSRPTRHLKTLTTLLEPFGVGLDIAAQMLIAAGATLGVYATRRFRQSLWVSRYWLGPARRAGGIDSTEVGPDKLMPPSTRAVIVGTALARPAIAYVERQTADQLSKKDFIRSIKRSLARELHRLLTGCERQQRTQ